MGQSKARRLRKLATRSGQSSPPKAPTAPTARSIIATLTQHAAATAAANRLTAEAVAALDADEIDRAAELVRDLIAMPEPNGEDDPPGLWAVDLLLHDTLLHLWDRTDEDGWVDLPLQQLQHLNGLAAAELRQSLTGLVEEYVLPDAVVAKIAAAVDLDRDGDAIFGGATDPAELLPAVLSVLHAIRLLRAAP